MRSEDLTNNNIDTLIESLELTTKPLQAFDRLLIETHEVTLTEANIQRLQKLVLRCILAIGGHSELALHCQDSEVEERALDILDEFHLMQKKDIVAVCLMRLFPEPQMKWTTLPPW